jgi:hypothetical protein
MSNSSQQPSSLDDLLIETNETFTVDTNTGSYTITLPNDVFLSTGQVNTNMSTISIGGSAIGGGGYLNSDTVTISGGNEFIWNMPEEWVDAFPDWSRVQDMCKQYPGLEIALRNFRTVYTLVKDDYDNPKTEN